MLIEIPLTPNPNRKFKINLNSQDCIINLYQKGSYLYLDLQVGTKIICQGSVCLNMVPIIQVANNIFNGNLVFVDILGHNAPNFSELNVRYFLLYYSADENLLNITQTRLN